MTPHKHETSPLNNFIKPLALLLIALGIAACEKNKNLKPPHNGQSVDISINVPEGFAPHDIKAIYRSNTCTYSGISMANGSKFTRDGYQNLTITPTAPLEKSVHRAEVPIDGGGDCKWKLSNIRFGLKYENTKKFGQNIGGGVSANIVVRFDQHRPPTGNTNEKKALGDLLINKEFYPWIHEQFIGGHKKSIHLIGQDGLHINFFAPQTRKIHFEPKIHEQFITYSKGYKEKVFGRDILFIYPDGSIQTEIQTRPNFEKLQRIRANAEKPQQ